MGRGSGTIFKWGGGGGKSAVTRKLPTQKFQFLLGLWALNFKNAFAKQKKNFYLSSVFFAKLRGRRLISLKVGEANTPVTSPPPVPGPMSVSLVFFVFVYYLHIGLSAR